MKQPAERTVTILQQQRLFDGYFKVDQYRLRHSLHLGGETDELQREMHERGHVVALLPVDTARDKLVLIEQFRLGAYAAGWDPWLLECVAGIIEPGETADEVAVRETREEAGCDVLDSRLVARFLTSPGATSETVALYVAHVDSRGLGGIHGLAHEGEDIKVHVLAIDDAMRLLDEGRIVNAKTIIALQWLRHNYRLIKNDWTTGASA